MSNSTAITLHGVNLIEASAGSGKTHKITELYLRLLLEKKLAAENILVVTYTVAATNELKTRIRSAITAELRKHGPGSLERGLLKKALLELDKASICTIHGFCKEILMERAFESGSLFGAELDPEERALLQGSVDDFFRHHVIQREIEELRLMKSSKKEFSYENAVQFTTRELFNPIVNVIPKMVQTPDMNVIKSCEEEIMQIHKELVDLWSAVSPDARSENPSIDELLMKRSIVSLCRSAGNVKMKCRAISSDFQEKFGQFNEKLAQYRLHSELFLKSQKLDLIGFIPKCLEERKKVLNILSYDDLIQNLWQALNDKISAGLLIDTVKARFKAVLIDEFQDTDPLQYDIFRKLFFQSPAAGGAETITFLIGDPKQSIYSFRGADIFSYRTSKDALTNRPYSLDYNWRSEEGLIKAINRIFTLKDHPFVYPWIPFTDARHPGLAKPAQETLKVEGPDDCPFELMVIDSSKVPDIMNKNRRINQGDCLYVIAQAVRDEIKRLLFLSAEGKACIGERPLKSSDFAILVGENREADFMKAELLKSGIASIIYSRISVFAAPECRELLCILKAVAEPSHESHLKTALLTSFLGYSYNAVYEMAEKSTELEQIMERFMRYHQHSREKSFIEMITVLIKEEKVKEKILSAVNPERKLTNLVHLIDLIQKEAHHSKLSMDGVVKWLEEKRRTARKDDEESLLRLESDENAVKIVTIHKSKGLEFPIVFIPFFFRNAKVPDEYYIKCHDDKGLIIDFGSDKFQENRMKAEREALAEHMRLFYVAMTRAMHKCYLIWGDFNAQKLNAPRFLFHYKGDVEDKKLIENLATCADSVTIKKDLEELAEDPNIALRYIPQQPQKSGNAVQFTQSTAEELKNLEFPSDRGIDNSRGITSFSRLTAEPYQEIVPVETESGKSYDEAEDAEEQGAPAEEPAAEEPAAEESAAQESAAQEPAAQESAAQEPSEGSASDRPTMFTLPRGAKTGTLFHEIMESLDYTTADHNSITHCVNEKLAQYGVGISYSECLVQAIHAILNTSLDRNVQGFTLSSISMKDRLSEISFHYPVKPIDSTTITALRELGKAGKPDQSLPAHIGSLRIDPFKGFIMGIIDLVFRYRERYYLLDWKTNYLGREPGDYSGGKLQQTMTAHHYDLQYYLYTLALDQYLRLKIKDYRYENHFGGVFYLFVRGMGSGCGDGCGIFHDRIPCHVVEKMREELLDLSRVLH